MIYTYSCNQIFGWSFDGLQITVERYRCEGLLAAGRVEEATEVLLTILETFGSEIRASKLTAKWVICEYRHANQVDGDNMYSQISRKNVSSCSKRSATRHSALESTARQLQDTPLHCLSILRIQ